MKDSFPLKTLTHSEVATGSCNGSLADVRRSCGFGRSAFGYRVMQILWLMRNRMLPGTAALDVE